MDIELLFIKHILGKSTKTEEQNLSQWRDENEGNAETYRLLSSEEHLRDAYIRRHAVDTEAALKEMKERVQGSKVQDSKSQIWLWKGIAAVALVLLAFTTTLLFIRPTEITVASLPTTMADSTSVMPGQMKATMVLANGETINMGNDTAANKKALLVSKGKTTLQGLIGSKQNEIIVPRGGEFKVTLEDGTTVWLNADSHLYYPESFTSNSAGSGQVERRVKVDGEAYFEVAHDSERPFIVETAGQVVRVLGTEFNVHSYPDEPTVLTTLVKGSIAMTPVDMPHSELRLTPGHQASFSKSAHDISVKTVNVSDVTGWRDGIIVFNNQTLGQIMKTLSRWYDFDYRFIDKPASQVEFAGQVTRYDNFDDVCRIIEKCGGIKIQRQGKTVIIRSN